MSQEVMMPQLHHDLPAEGEDEGEDDEGERGR